MQVNGSLTALGGIVGQNRAGLVQDELQSFPLELQLFQIWDEFGRMLPNVTSAGALTVASFAWNAASLDATFFVANRDWRVVGITARIEVAGTDGSAVTGAIKKALSGTDIASGTILHASTINLKGTVDTNQVLTLSTTATDLDIPAGTAIGIDLTGTLTNANGVVSVFLAPLSPDDLALTAGAFGTGCPYITTADVKNMGAITRYARMMFTMPAEYDPGQSLTLTLSAGMITTVASVSATVDVEVYKSGDNGLVSGTDICSTAAQSINSLTFGEKTFVLSGSGLVIGTVLDIRITIAANDSATVTAVIGAVAMAQLNADIKG